MQEILDIPDNIPQELLDKAECVIVIPSMTKVAIGIGGSYGRGAMVCRTGKAFDGPWGAPAMYSLDGGSFGLQLGDIEIVGPRRAFPLGLFTARTFIGERLALVGDAAHIIHPIAGQGLNMGLRDVAALAETIADAARLGLDPGGPEVLERYQRWRRFDTMTMGVATDGLNRLFSNHSDALRLVRDIGLGLVERMPMLKRMFIREAAGVTGDVPKLLKGEAL